jgi:hypothetical protein
MPDLTKMPQSRAEESRVEGGEKPVQHYYIAHYLINYRWGILE